MEFKEISAKINTFFLDKPEVLTAIVFGSYARETFTDKSDIDIAILMHHAKLPSSYQILQWQEDLVDLLRKKVDLVCLNTASPILGVQVVQEGKTVFINDTKTFAEFKMYLFSDYAELKELRAPMERDILNRRYFNES